MARYIDADALKRKLIDEKNFYPAIVARALEEMPIADVVEVKHGEWENVVEQELYCPDAKTTITTTTQTCSNCKIRTGFIGPKRYRFDHNCPHCGAKMDGGVQG